MLKIRRIEVQGKPTISSSINRKVYLQLKEQFEKNNPGKEFFYNPKDWKEFLDDRKDIELEVLLKDIIE